MQREDRTRIHAVFCTLFIALFITGSAASATSLELEPNADLGPPTITVLEEDAGGLQLQIDLPALALESYEIEGARYHSFAIEGGELQGLPGEPALPIFTRFVSIPATAGTELRIVSIEEETRTNLHLLPMQDEEEALFAIDRELYGRDAFLGGEAVTIGAPAIMRDLRVVALTFHPVRFNPVRDEVRIARRVVVEVKHAGLDLRNAKVRASQAPSEFMESLYRSTVVNYARTGEESGTLGNWLIISRDNAQVIDILQPLIEWRERMGYHVEHATTAVTGTSTTSIKNYIQDAYNGDYPPDFIVMVGDVGGSFPLPTFYEDYSGYHGEGDHGYVELEGNDMLPDACTGRLSAEDTTTLERIVNKIIGYESTPYMEDTSWFTRAVLTGDPIDSGPSCVYIQQWLKDHLRDIGYTQIDTIFTEPFRSVSVNRINQGCTFYGYRGIYGMSGISSGDISALQNGWKLAFAINLTCDTGSWAHGTSRNEAWLRAGVGTTTATGGIGSIGTATIGTHTRYNNSFYTGSTYGLFWEGHQCIGMAHARGKIEMYNNFFEHEPDTAHWYCYWNTLMGDPATVIWTDVPEELTVLYSSEVPLGANVVTISVADDRDAPVENAWVHLYQEGVFSRGGRTDAAGLVTIPIDDSNAGTVQVTVTGRNLYPHQGSLTIAQADRYVGLASCNINDSAGNGDGELNPGEEVGLIIALRNYGPLTASGVVLTASCADPYVGWIGTPSLSYGTITGYNVVQPPAALMMRLYQGCPTGHVVQIDLEITAGADLWHSLVTIPVTGQKLVYSAHELGGVGTRLDPGESGSLIVELENTGDLNAEGPIQAMLSSTSYGVEVIDPHGTYGAIPGGGSGSNVSDPFTVSSPADWIPGQQIELRLDLVDNAGVRQTTLLALTVGTADSHDPTGPDAYGYYAYDHTDTSYPDAPTYDWVEINPNSGGPGTSVGLGDYGYREDDSRTLTLPFTFRYYGQDYDVITVCSNGWISMGQTYQVTFSNYAMPCAFAPPNCIGAFWDDLYQSGSGQVYYWHDESEHRFIVSWDNVRRRRGWWQYDPEAFEIILLDPAHYPTRSGDGEILMQFEVVNNTDYEGMYATCGIQNADHTDGVMFAYFNSGPATAADLDDDLAVKFTTQAPGFSHAEGLSGVNAHLSLAAGPNPWSAATNIHFNLPHAADVALRVLDMNGRCVRTLSTGALPAGPQMLRWSGSDDAGTALPAGIYLLQLRAGTEELTRRTVLIR